MNNFTFYSPTEFVFGKDTEGQVGGLVKKYNGSKVLIVYGGGSVIRSGLMDKVKSSLDAAGVKYAELGGVQPNPIDTKVYEGIELGRKEQIDFLLPVGGGSVIDTAKAIALGMEYEGDFWDFYIGKATPVKAIPVGVVLTIPAAGSEGSGNSVITKTDGLQKLGVRTDKLLRPLFSIMNPELTYTLPAWQTACGITDMMAHIMERYFTNTEGVEISDRLAEGVLKAIITESPKVMAEPRNYDARANIMWAGMLAHNNVCGVGRVQDWASHHIEHELSAMYDVTHGAGLAVITPAWMRYVLKINPHKLVQFATRVWDIEPQETEEATALKGIEAFEAFLKKIGMPLTFEEIGAKANLSFCSRTQTGMRLKSGGKP